MRLGAGETAQWVEQVRLGAGERLWVEQLLCSHGVPKACVWNLGAEGLTGGSVEPVRDPASKYSKAESHGRGHSASTTEKAHAYTPMCHTH